MPEFTYTDLGTVVDPDGGRAAVRGLHHPADDDRRAQYEVIVEGSLQLDAATPGDRAKLEALIRALQTAVANGEAVGWLGAMPAKVRVKTPAVVEWTATSPGRTVKVS